MQTSLRTCSFLKIAQNNFRKSIVNLRTHYSGSLLKLTNIFPVNNNHKYNCTQKGTTDNTRKLMSSTTSSIDTATAAITTNTTTATI